MSISWRYSVVVSQYAKKHFIKSFQKKYKTWVDTYQEIQHMLSHIDRFLLSTKAEKIHISKGWYIVKCEFKIVWSHESAKSSWNRIIVYVDEEILEVQILLIYCKNDVAWWNETQWWQQVIKINHTEVYKYFNY